MNSSLLTDGPAIQEWFPADRAPLRAYLALSQLSQFRIDPAHKVSRGNDL